ncbi:protein-L-isoaspartate O-methyltransferase family protein [Pseudochelatococcus lubricantis]|uniref:protein-L-isoaspartate O-methyltransferase family protein n=1 Tax=Pseudochelatococcus lubricantis TaxID=1538102 RepID=UPI003672E84D
MFDFSVARRRMVDCQVRTFDVTDRALLAVLEDLPRERFVPEDRQVLAFSDQHLVVSPDIEHGRFLLAPLIFARMAQELGAGAGKRVLDVGAATGYGSVVLARLGANVTALESDGTIAAHARDLAAEFGEGRINVVTGPLEAGWKAGAPYDAILINGAFEAEPAELLSQLAENGHLVGIDHDSGAPKAVIIQRAGTAFGSRTLFNAPAPVLDGFRAPSGFVF